MGQGFSVLTSLFYLAHRVMISLVSHSLTWSSQIFPQLLPISVIFLVSSSPALLFGNNLILICVQNKAVSFHSILRPSFSSGTSHLKPTFSVYEPVCTSLKFSLRPGNTPTHSLKVTFSAHTLCLSYPKGKLLGYIGGEFTEYIALSSWKESRM